MTDNINRGCAFGPDKLERCAVAIGYPADFSELTRMLSADDPKFRAVLEGAEEIERGSAAFACLCSIETDMVESELERVYACEGKHVPGIVRRVLPMLVYTYWKGEPDDELLLKVMPHLMHAIAGDSAGIEDAINEAAMRF